MPPEAGDSATILVKNTRYVPHGMESAGGKDMADLENRQGLGPIPASLIDRAKAMILRPVEEWTKIAAETDSQNDILKSYVLPLAAIGPIAGLIGGQVFGYGALFVSYRPSLMSGLVSAVLGFALTIVGVYVLAAIADWLAPKFEGQSNKLGAFKLVAYGGTAAWLAGIFSLIPMLAVFALLGLYSLYLFYTGAGPMMAVPEAKRIAYTVVTFLAAAVLYWIVMLLVGSIVAMVGLGAVGMGAIAGASEDEVTVSIPGVGSVNTSQLEKIGKQAEDAAAGKIPAIPASKMQQLLPVAVGAWQRSATETMAIGPMGSTAEGTYTNGDKSFKLRIIDMAGMGALAGLGAAIGVEQSREDATGYERTQSVDGQMQTESWNNGSSSGKFATTIDSRFMVEAEGDAASIEDLKSAVAQIDTDALAGLAE
jgi:Yip1 domain